MARNRRPPDWLAGVWIEAISAAIITGKSPERRLERLREFWKAPGRSGGLFGPLLAAPGTSEATSFYDTGPLSERLIDFERLNGWRRCRTPSRSRS